MINHSWLCEIPIVVHLFVRLRSSGLVDLPVYESKRVCATHLLQTEAHGIDEGTYTPHRHRLEPCFLPNTSQRALQ